MSDVHHTRVYGGLVNCRPWLSACVKFGFIPDTLFTLGRRYVIATSERGDLYMRRGPKGPLDITCDPSLFNTRLRNQARAWLRRYMSDTIAETRTVSWTIKTIHEDEGNSAHPVS